MNDSKKSSKSKDKMKSGQPSYGDSPPSKVRREAEPNPIAEPEPEAQGYGGGSSPQGLSGGGGRSPFGGGGSGGGDLFKAQGGDSGRSSPFGGGGGGGFPFGGQGGSSPFGGGKGLPKPKVPEGGGEGGGSFPKPPGGGEDGGSFPKPPGGGEGGSPFGGGGSPLGGGHGGGRESEKKSGGLRGGQQGGPQQYGGGNSPGMRKERRQDGGGGCAPIIVLFTRGTGDPGGPDGTVVGPGLAKAVKNQAGASFQGIQYPADGSGIATEVSGSGPGSTAMAQTAQKLSSSCPNAKIVLSGYSQGAMSVHGSAKKGQGTWLKKVCAAITFGDPFKQQPPIQGDKFKTFCGGVSYAYPVYRLRPI
ncbi:cutinase-domain-containing protein [Phyllosticta citrichinensis]